MRTYRSSRVRAIAVSIAAAVFSASLFSGCDLPPIYEYWDSIVLNELEISPTFMVLQEGQKATFSILGGKVPYRFSLSGSGAITSLAGQRVEYAAPATAATTTEAWLTVSDIYGAQSSGRVIVEESISQLAIFPERALLAYGATLTFSHQGGKPPYTFSIEYGLGSVDEATGLYTAPAEDTDALVRLQDGSGQYSDAAISVRAGVQALAIMPLEVTLETGEPLTFSASGGVSPYTYSVVSGVGTIGAGTGVYVSGTEGAATVRVTDSNIPAGTADTAVTVVAITGTPLVIIPRSIDLVLGVSFQFSADGGVPPYAFSMVSSYGGAIDTVTGVYTAPITRQGVEQVAVTDSRGISDIATIKVKKK